MSYKRRLIDVASPLGATSAALAREKWMPHGHPSTLHLRSAHRRLGSGRVVLWAPLVDDPSAHPGGTIPSAVQQLRFLVCGCDLDSVGGADLQSCEGDLARGNLRATRNPDVRMDTKIDSEEGCRQ